MLSLKLLSKISLIFNREANIRTTINLVYLTEAILSSYKYSVDRLSLFALPYLSEGHPSFATAGCTFLESLP